MCSLLELFSSRTDHEPTQGRFLFLISLPGGEYTDSNVCTVPYRDILRKLNVKTVPAQDNVIYFYFYCFRYKLKHRGEDCCCVMLWEPRISAPRFMSSGKFSPVQAPHSGSIFSVFVCSDCLVWDRKWLPGYQVLRCKPSSPLFSVQVGEIVWFHVSLFFFFYAPLCWTEWRPLDSFFSQVSSCSSSCIFLHKSFRLLILYILFMTLPTTTINPG